MSMRSSFIAFAAFVCLSVASVANAAPMTGEAWWDTSYKAGTEDYVAGSAADHITALDLTRGSTLAANAASNNFGATGWSGSDAGDYFQFGFTVDAGYSVTLDELYMATRSSATGPGTIGIFTSLDNYANPVASISQPSATYVNGIYDLSSLGAITGTFYIRLYEIGNTAPNGGTTAGTGTFRVGDYYDGSFANIVLTGETSPLVAPVPVPAAAWLLGSGLFGLAGLRRRNG